jgi:hypothetical protein
MRSDFAFEILFYIDDPVGEGDKEIIPLTLNVYK